MTEDLETETKAGVQMNWFSSEPCVNEEVPETSQTNEEPEEQWLKLDEQLPELTAECVESEDLSTLLQQEPTKEEAGADTGLDPDQLLQSESESYSEPDNDEEWEPPSSPIAQQEKEADEYHVKPAKTKVIQWKEKRNMSALFSNSSGDQVETEFWPIDGMDSDSDNDPFKENESENRSLRRSSQRTDLKRRMSQKQRPGP
ncbi:hypothetical protein WMY93_024737 [Mugilogobius chulae]|uniref:Uncharacterized protein n=1 Tax=Mugilogobius chulae TaxID=88201 RepID=A0AAW0NAH4_9GOBI